MSKSINTDTAKAMFQEMFYKVDETKGGGDYDVLRSIKTKTGVLVIHETIKYWNTKTRKKVLFSKGVIYENNKAIGRYRL